MTIRSAFLGPLASVLIGALGPFPSVANASSIALTGAVVYDGANDGYGWTSSTGLGGYYLYIAPNSLTGGFINASDGTINYNLSPGQNIFYIIGFGDLPIGSIYSPDYGPLQETFGLNLFVNQTTTSFESAPIMSGTTASNYGTEPLFTSNPLTATTPGSLTDVTGGDLITLSLFNFDITTTQYNLVSAFSPTPFVGEGGDAVGEFVLDVTPLSPAPIPEPASLPLFATGLGALGLLGWRRKRKGGFVRH